MKDEKIKISLICDSGDFESLTAFLLAKEYQVFLFSSIPHALWSREFYSSDLLILDAPHEEFECKYLFSRIWQESPSMKIISGWEPGCSLHSERIPHFFRIMKKPPSKSKLLMYINEAITSNSMRELRREPRVALEIPAEFHFNFWFWKMRTRNISLKGMQAVCEEECWRTDEDIPESIIDRRGQECVLYPENGLLKPIPVPVRIRYVRKKEQNRGKPVIGFEFGNLDAEYQRQLYELMVG